MLNQADFEISHVWNFKVLANKKFTNAAFESAIRVSSQLLAKTNTNVSNSQKYGSELLKASFSKF